MNEFEFRKLRLTDGPAFLKSCEDWDHASGFIWARGYEPGISFSEYLKVVDNMEKGIDLPEGIVPDTHYYAFIGSTIVGRLAIRHRLNDFLFRIGGHIGYGVIPAFRRRGYAKELLRLSLPIAKQMGMDKVLVTCDDGNIGSMKTIEANGGVLENMTIVGPGLPLKRRYWIALP